MSPELNTGHSGKSSCWEREECFENSRFWVSIAAGYLWNLWPARKQPGPSRHGTNCEVEIWVNTCLAQDPPEEARGIARKRISFRWLWSGALNTRAPGDAQFGTTQSSLFSRGCLCTVCALRVQKQLAFSELVYLP